MNDVDVDNLHILATIKTLPYPLFVKVTQHQLNLFKTIDSKR